MCVRCYQCVVAAMFSVSEVLSVYGGGHVQCE